MHAILDDQVLLEVEGSEKFMFKLTQAMLEEERSEGKAEGKAEGEARGKQKQAESSILLAIETNMPRTFIDALAKQADIPAKRLEELYKKASPRQIAS
jgi:flagellar biosynthesis/type III secretory pathway protein FliH